MDCSHVIEQLPAYQEKELTEEVYKSVKAHLETCQACQKEERLLSQSWSLVGTLSSIEPSSNFRETFWNRVEREERSLRDSLREMMRPLLMPAMASFVLAWLTGLSVGLFFFRAAPTIGLGEDMFSSPTARSLAVFTSGQPMNSIEEWVLSKSEMRRIP